MENIVILGAGGHSKVIIDIIKKKAALGKEKVNIYLLDDNVPAGTIIMGYEVVGTIDECYNYKDSYFVIGIGDNKTRKRISQKYKLAYISVIHPNAMIANDVVIGEGTVIAAGVVVNSGTIIGEHCIINTAATVDHDNRIGSYSHISPGAHLGGAVIVDECVWIGLGSNVINNIKVSEDTIVGAGSLVIKDIFDSGVYVGHPVQLIKKR